MTDRYAVFGNPIAQSLSPKIHQMFAEQTGEPVDYQRQLIAADSFASAVQSFFQTGGCGLNITVPFKLEAFALADRLSDRAQSAGAVNTLYQSDGSLVGDNTDGVGLCTDLTVNLEWNLERANILLFGAGGAARGVLLPLLAANPASITVANRTVSKAESLVADFSGFTDTVVLKASRFEDVSQPYDIVINGTSASLSSDLPPLQPHIVQGACCYDMMYGVKPTRFMQWAQSQGASQVADGLGMLVEQAAEAFYVWRGVRPQTEHIVERVRASL